MTLIEMICKVNIVLSVILSVCVIAVAMSTISYFATHYETTGWDVYIIYGIIYCIVSTICVYVTFTKSYKELKQDKKILSNQK